MKLRKWLEQVNCYQLGCRIWIDGKDKPVFEGSIYNIPWIYTEMELDDKLDKDRISILYVDILTGTEDNKYRNKPGFIIYLK